MAALPCLLTMPLSERELRFDGFPPFFEGLLPEGEMLDGLLRQRKIDRGDLFGQLVAVGEDVVGAVTIFEDDAMNRCPITYEPCGKAGYSRAGLRLLSPNLECT